MAAKMASEIGGQVVAQDDAFCMHRPSRMKALLGMKRWIEKVSIHARFAVTRGSDKYNRSFNDILE